MFSIFLMPYTSELLFGWYSRNQNISGLTNNEFKAVAFGTKSFKPGFLNNANLEYFLDRAKPILTLDENEIVKNHTLLPLYMPFMPKKKLDKINEKEFNNKDLGFAGFRAFSRNKIIKVCPLCLNEEINKYGEGFIHREHQVPGNKVCDKHKVYLKKIDHKEEVFLDLSSLTEADLKYIDNNEIFLDKYARIAIEINYILNANISGYNNRLISEKYTDKLRQIKQYRLGSKLNWDTITKGFIDFFGEDFLKDINSIVSNDTKNNWLRLMLSETVYANPIRHILFIIFLFGSVKAFFEYEIKISEPFGNGPWPCLNKKSPHFSENKINDCEVKYNHTTKEGGQKMIIQNDTALFRSRTSAMNGKMN